MDTLKDWARKLLGVELVDEQIHLFARYDSLLTAWNQKLNLTAIRDRKEALIKHYLDSLTVFLFLPFNQSFSLIDIGTGAGFPGIPLKIANPQIHLTLVDSARKKVDFCRLAVEELGLTGTRVEHARAEDLGHSEGFRENYDWSIARAVAAVPALAEYLLPLTKIGGHVLMMKGAQIQAELDQSQNAVVVLGGRISEVKELALPEGYGKRNLVLIEKVRPTPLEYPRKAGTPAKKPLF